ncbi:MAG: insulinase family protein [Bacteroidota bacterium]|nr:insulinase family protein [Bacteroidota bacterium]MDP4233475.1 insulinase family protein [Bacteroidota bacterium]MDP4243353.1 insulinase family protein [Bacteroidota bacterium]MDP4287961.1 insulinase family protein [Bacteroidota bacterium]
MKNLLRYCYVFLATIAIASCAASHSSSSSSLANSSNIVNDVQEFDVDGIHILMRQSVSVPVVSAILFVRGGSVLSPASEPIMTESFAVAIATASGSERTSKSYFRRRMTQMQTFISGAAGNDYSALSLTCTRENFDTSWKYFTDVATRPAFDATEFENFMHATLLGLSSVSSDPDSYSRHEADSIYFAGHPYGRVPTVDDVNQVTLPLIERHFKSIMVKSRFLLSVVGNISREELTEKVHSTLGKLPEGTYTAAQALAPLDPPARASRPGAYLFSFNRKLPTNYVLAYFHVPTEGDSDYYPYLRLRNFFGGFVFNHIRVQHNLAYAPNVDDKQQRSSIGMIELQTPFVDSAVKIIYSDVDFFQNNLIRESAIREGVAGWATRNYLKAETTANQAVLLGQAKLLTGDWRDAFFSYEKLSHVTPEQLAHVAQKYLRNFNWFIVGDTTGIDRARLESR